ncbi:2-oxoglutarate dehydrogenase E1 component [Niastella yeongjuensis]|uniref:oxoglutarate dehydrogenase (succinyl-transferring) n=1 Tax=Niastella yeongjuensis TaxID=354355 RepID=A0A1V9EAK2_9BACT|nr:2-oxoglutarate dehydrogenase E1 component [Niastella yeongjuensis]OQP42965.1 2-oxoglutarate dehydrogenase E1 component [Niastella yeongjuensis]SEO61180.1 2-oxoglutarate dehydrogenase E1 component [Niastella yeongjuensis]
MERLTYLNNGNAAYISSLYEAYQHDPASIEMGWQKFFEGFDFGASQDSAIESPETTTTLTKEINVYNLIDGYRTRGHLFAKTNPVRKRRQYLPGKELGSFGLSDADLDTVFKAGAEVGLGAATLRDIRQLLEETYCGPIGVEYKYANDPESIKWFQDKMESVRNKPGFSQDDKKQILHKLTQAVVFESFLQTKFLGQKRFSLEGGEIVIPALDLLIEKGAGNGVKEFVIGMGHRGRLNVLANIMGKPYKEVFAEFQGKTQDHDGSFSGDVKYHLGYSNDVTTVSGQPVHLSVSANPSHLEAVNAVVEGITRSKVDFKYSGDYNQIVPVILHGDSSIAGQGVVYEVLQMEKLAGYRTGGTIHLVINNQVGFTTDYKDARSSTYCTDLAKIVSAPVFHVNGDDAEALGYVIGLAIDYRQTFHGDVFIDVLCYRKYGHNESDEPRFTQPLLYKSIDSHPNPKEIYAQKLVAEGTINQEYPKEIEVAFKDALQSFLDESKEIENIVTKPLYRSAWEGLRKADETGLNAIPETAVSAEILEEIGNGITTLPTDKAFLKKIEKVFEGRRKMVQETKIFDWAMGELLAYGSLLKEGFPVRVSGEDVKRGTFSHRHATATAIDSGEEFVPLNNIGASGKFEIYNSLLSEYGVLGFEYGYASANPNALVVWEAQYGDFLNTGQVIVDQYVVSAEAKWQLGNGLVLLLPHGYEGAGPEHTSARIERFMALCANNNIQLVNCTTPANFFHVLRRQLHRDFRVPLIVFAPKSLLRHPLCVSPITEFTQGKFRELIDDAIVNSGDVKQVLFCSGKIYYDLLQRQQENKRGDVAIVRIEQLYPTPFDELKHIKEKYTAATEFIWVQEEPENMGAWPYLCRKLHNYNLNLQIIARPEASSPATGFSKQHVAEQTEIVNRAFGKN